MWGPVNGLAYPRSARVRESFSDAMQELQVPTLETFPLSAPRADQTHDGLHYFAINARDAQLRKGMKLMSNIVGLTILQLFLNYLCNE
ncbi:hypothetical protein GUITHDRAFT_122970 [Guillardia theta CCMP2712]|uniref:Uncharacterized protein n=2 Tax=Guillardia theta TaxID=55529 RepID=L1I3N6_GUITC|nr:hypothetical protein GUITHDRAFT_122970 [Guillardia theta CCMP2712]EKX30816.1 hypothetical protein GUITHDRAFT_122970 [Guillardia theta CCMP2712]|eukprot:XP_005817796.1 hypothetical protein GUITHDRAFT_122970 [Guillardia theta CCMP2712]